MNINKDNYEAFILDHLEGNLSQEESALLMAFLEENPDLDADFEIDIEGVRETVPEEFELDTSELTAGKDDIPESVNLWLAKRLEGDADALKIPITDATTQKHWDVMQKCTLDAETVSSGLTHDLLIPTGIESLDTWKAAVAEGDVTGKLADSYKALEAEEVALFAKTKLTPTAVSFGDKSSLKRSAKVVSIRPLMYRVAAVAAALLVLLTIGGVLLQDNTAHSGKLLSSKASRIGVEKGVMNTASASNVALNETQTDAVEIQFAADTPIESETPSEAAPAQKRVIVEVDQLMAIETNEIATPSTTPVLTANLMDLPELPPVDESLAMEVPQSTDEAEPWQDFLVGEAKKKVLGREQEKDEKFIDALAKKVEEKSDGKVVLAKKDDSQKFYFRIGKLEIKR